MKEKITTTVSLTIDYQMSKNSSNIEETEPISTVGITIERLVSIISEKIHLLRDKNYYPLCIVLQFEKAWLHSLPIEVVIFVSNSKVQSYVVGQDLEYGDVIHNEKHFGDNYPSCIKRIVDAILVFLSSKGSDGSFFILTFFCDLLKTMKGYVVMPYYITFIDNESSEGGAGKILFPCSHEEFTKTLRYHYNLATKNMREITDIVIQGESLRACWKKGSNLYTLEDGIITPQMKMIFDQLNPWSYLNGLGKRYITSFFGI